MIHIRIITFNRPDSVKMLLSKLPHLDNYFTVTVFDNSTNDLTMQVVNKFPSFGYVRTGHNIGFQRNYLSALFCNSNLPLTDYVWILADDDFGHMEFMLNVCKSFPEGNYSWIQLFQLSYTLQTISGVCRR